MRDWTEMARRDFDCDAPEGQQLAAFPEPDECGTPDLFGDSDEGSEQS